MHAVCVYKWVIGGLKFKLWGVCIYVWECDVLIKAEYIQRQKLE